MMSPKYKRKKYLIDPSFQMKFILKFCCVVAASSVVVGMLLLFFFRNSTTVAIENTQVVVKSTAAFFMPQLLFTLVIVALFSASVILVLALMASHRISGPIFRLTREIDSLKEGDLSRDFRIRERDQLQNLAGSLKGMSGSLREKHAAIREKYTVLQDYLKSKNFCLSPEDKEQTRAILKEIKTALDHFKL